MISFKVAFYQAFLVSASNLVAYKKFLGSGMKCDTSEPDYPKVGNSFFSPFTTSLKTLFKKIPIIFAEIYAPFHSFCDCLIYSRIFNRASPKSSSGCVWLPSRMSPIDFINIHISSESSSVYDSSNEA